MGYQSPRPHWFYGHRVECFNLDMLCRGPLPEHHPQLWQLAPVRSALWTVKIVDLNDIDDFEKTVHHYTGAPVLAMKSTSCAPWRLIEINVWAKMPELMINGNKIGLVTTRYLPVARWCTAPRSPVSDGWRTDGARSAAGTISVRHPWRETMRLARLAADRYSRSPRRTWRAGRLP